MSFNEEEQVLANFLLVLLVRFESSFRTPPFLQVMLCPPLNRRRRSSLERVVHVCSVGHCGSSTTNQTREFLFLVRLPGSCLKLSHRCLLQLQRGLIRQY